MRLQKCDMNANYVASRYLLIGPNGTGKTKFAGTYPGTTLWINIEGRIEVGVKEGDCEVKVKTIEEIEEVIKYLATDNYSQGHFCNVVLDSWTQFYKLHEEATKKKYADDKNSYKKWEKLNTTLFEMNDKFQGLKTQGINVVLTASGTYLKNELGNMYFALEKPRDQIVFALVDSIFLFSNSEKEGYKLDFKFPTTAIPSKTLPPINEKYPAGKIDPTKGFEELMAPYLYTEEAFKEQRAKWERLASESRDRNELRDKITQAIKAKKTTPTDLKKAIESCGFSPSTKLHEMTLDEITKVIKELKL